mmetsp:Transcript_27417/g.42021  ORF Transcript_27417/g.42021 Transcript_27417/m.42021 type:complete len:505 (+) Transcript_27417:180-1694(+)
MKTIVFPFALLAIPSFVSCQTYETTVSRRERNLDHWDAETLAAYLGLDPDTALPLDDDTYVGIDASIMFYAQWCKNCHKFAPVWDTIAQLVHAGSTEGNLIMALFNCELNDQHTKLCSGAGVTHYPTLMYVGAGPYHDSDPITSAVLGDKASGPYGPTILDRTVKFQGNLNIGDSVLDWVKAMRGLSTWYKWNNEVWLRGLRDMFQNPFGKKRQDSDKSKDALPIGVPTGLKGGSSKSKTSATSSSTSASASSSVSAYKLEKELKTVEEKLAASDKKLSNAELASTHGGYVIDSFLFPATETVSNTTKSIFNGTDAKEVGEESATSVNADAFTKMIEFDGWDSSQESNGGPSNAFILKSCIVDLTLDYCTRLSTRKTTEYLDSISTLPDSEYPSFTTMEAKLTALVAKTEPYCANFNKCYANNFKKTEEGFDCRPTDCPFNNKAACAYVSGCLSSHIHDEYKDALDKLDSANSTSAAEPDSASAASATPPKEKTSSGGSWGMKK